MATIVTRVTGATAKNSPLSNTEIDNNFINLNTDKQETADCVSTNTANKVVKRDASGNFIAGQITAGLTGTATQANNVNGGVAGAVHWQSAVNTTGFTAAGTAGQLLKSNGTTVPTWVDQSSIIAGNATKLAASRTIAISTGATGTATSFDGSSNITIPITAIDAGYISAGTLAVARLGTTAGPQFGSVGIGVAASGTAGELKATTGTFSGNTSAVNSTLTGTLNSVNATLSGTLTFNNSTKQTAAAPVNININALTSGTSYTRPTNLLYALVIATGGGGGAGGADLGDTGSGSGSGGGGAGGTAIRMYTAAQLGATCAYVIGANGTGGSATNGTNGTAGGTTTFTPSGGGTALSAPGGALGAGTGVPTVDGTAAGGVGGNPTGGVINIQGGDGDYGIGADAGEFGKGGGGGASFWGGGATGTGRVTSAAGVTGQSGRAYGSGGGGTGVVDSTTGGAGGNGKPGVIFILEYLGS